VLVALPAAAAAQQIPPGLWTGTISPPDEQARDVTYEVVAAGDSVTGTLRVPSLPDFPAVPMVGLKRDAEGRITFSFTAGRTASCLLAKQQDETYAGTCTTDDGSAAGITMSPPKPGGAG
jgi:hypothetical protein